MLQWERGIIFVVDCVKVREAKKYSTTEYGVRGCCWSLSILRQAANVGRVPEKSCLADSFPETVKSPPERGDRACR